MSEKKEKQRFVKRTLLFMMKTAWKNKPGLFVSYILRLASEVCAGLASILLPKVLIDRLVLIGSGQSFEAHFPYILLTVGLIVGINFLTGVITNATVIWKNALGEWFNEYFAEQMGRQVMEMDFEHTEDPEALDQLNKAKEGISWYSGGVTGILDQFYTIVMNLTLLAGVVALMVMGCPWLILVQAAAVLLIYFFNMRNNKIQIESFKKLAKINRVFGYVFYQLSQFRYGKDVRLYESRDMMCEKANSHNRDMVGLWQQQAIDCRKNSWYMDIVNGLRDGISYFYIGYLAVTKAITIGDFSMYVSSASTFYRSLANIVTGWQEILKRCNYAHEYILFLDYPAAMVKGTKALGSGEHTIEFSHVSFRYPRSENWVLRDLCLTIRSGEHLSVVGLNGAGKTTFIKLLCRLYDVTEGEILVDGVNIKEYSDEEYRRLFAVVFQDFELFAFTLRENIAFTEDGGSDKKINEALKLSGLYEDSEKLEKGLDTVIYKSFDEKGTDLSGGQRQKVAISRALYKDAPVVILDEPTAALDPVAEYEIYRHFNSLVGGKTAIYISHRLSSCKFCDKIAVFAEDTIKEYGTHNELVSKEKGLYAEMFAAQAQYYA